MSFTWLMILWGLVGLTIIITSLLIKDRPPLLVFTITWLYGFMFIFASHIIGG